MARRESRYMDTAHQYIVLVLYILHLHRITPYYVTQRQPRPYLGYFQVTLVQKYLQHFHAAAGLVCRHLTRKLAGDLPVSTSNMAAISDSDTGHKDDLAPDFDALGDELIDQSVQSRERFEAEPEEEAGEEVEQSGGQGKHRRQAENDAHSQSAPSHASLVPNPLNLPSAAARRTWHQPASKTCKRLSELFIFPAHDAQPSGLLVFKPSNRRFRCRSFCNHSRLTFEHLPIVAYSNNISVIGPGCRANQ